MNVMYKFLMFLQTAFKRTVFSIFTSFVICKSQKRTVLKCVHNTSSNRSQIQDFFLIYHEGISIPFSKLSQDSSHRRGNEGMS